MASGQNLKLVVVKYINMAERHHMEHIWKWRVLSWKNTCTCGQTFLIVKFVTNFVIQAAEKVL